MTENPVWDVGILRKGFFHKKVQLSFRESDAWKNDEDSIEKQTCEKLFRQLRSLNLFFCGREFRFDFAFQDFSI